MMHVYSWLIGLFNDNFMPHGMCYMWEPFTLWSNVIGDSVTAISYFLIPTGLIYFLRKRKDFDMPGILLAFAAFIISCGAVHAISVVNVWVPLYNTAGILKGFMAVVSAGTVGLMYAKMPLALSLPSPSQLQKLNNELQHQITEKELLQKELEEKAEALEKTLKLLNDTQNAANIGSWKVDLKNEEVYWSEQVYKIHQIPVGEKIELNLAINLFRDNFRGKVEQTVEEAIVEHKPWDERWQLNVGDEYKWVQSIGYPVLDGDEVIALEGMFMDKDDQIRNEIALHKRTKELEESNKDLEAFSYSISHDLRAPLRSINGFSDILIEDFSDKLEGEGVRLLNIIKTNALKMGELIDDILTYSRLGRQEPEFKTVDLNKLIQAIINDQKVANGSLNIHFEIKELGSVKGDLILLKQLFQNLIENAIKYSSKQERIEIEIGSTHSEGKQLCYVKDNGVGFDDKYHDKIFGVFQRLHSSQEFSGTGVGLSIVKRIIDKHKGRIWAKSKPGKGATFFVFLENAEKTEGNNE